MTHKQRIAEMLAVTFERDFQGNQWGQRHVDAWRRPRGFEVGIVSVITALADYADCHGQAYESPIGEDYVLGKAWADMVRNARVLLGGELGRLDGGTLNGLLCGMLKAEGCEVEG